MPETGEHFAKPTIRERLSDLGKRWLPDERTRRQMEVFDRVADHLPEDKHELAAGIRPVVEHTARIFNYGSAVAEVTAAAAIAGGGLYLAGRSVADTGFRDSLGRQLKRVPSSLSFAGKEEASRVKRVLWGSGKAPASAPPGHSDISQQTEAPQEWQGDMTTIWSPESYLLYTPTAEDPKLPNGTLLGHGDEVKAYQDKHQQVRLKAVEGAQADVLEERLVGYGLWETALHGVKPAAGCKLVVPKAKRDGPDLLVGQVHGYSFWSGDWTADFEMTGQEPRILPPFWRMRALRSMFSWLDGYNNLAAADRDFKASSWKWNLNPARDGIVMARVDPGFSKWFLMKERKEAFQQTVQAPNLHGQLTEVLDPYGVMSRNPIFEQVFSVLQPGRMEHMGSFSDVGKMLDMLTSWFSPQYWSEVEREENLELDKLVDHLRSR